MSDVIKTRTPNEEQLKAITHLEGMTLSAGAGAGKTFVLVEHLIFRLDDLYLKEFQGKWNELSTKDLQAKLLKMVMITFTRKASGELATRIRERVNEKIIGLEQSGATDTHLNYWRAVEENLHLIFVSTIHSFCQRILAQKSVFVPVQEIEIVDDVIYQHKIRKLFEEYLKINETHIPLSYLLFSSDVEKAIQKIFLNVESRLKWGEAPDVLDESKMFTEMFSQMQKILHLEEVWDFVPVPLQESKKPKKWMEVLGDYNRLCAKYEGIHSWTLDALLETLETFKSFRKSTYAEASAEQVSVLEKIHDLKNNKKLKPFLESTQAYLENKDFINGLYRFIKNSFSYLEENFYRDGRVGFNDLEYLIVKFLNNTDSKNILDKQYDLIVVDEFQDTSHVQFNILNIISNGNFSKVVAVGDLKQAIYGFRGGEVGVFVETKKLVKTNLNLSHNYRSEEKIINFNNEFFKFIFPLGLGFEKSDRFGFDFEGQSYPHPPDANKQLGRIHVQKINLDWIKKPSTFDVRKIEAKNIADTIESLIEKGQTKSIAVLFRKLTGSELLIEELQNRAIKFSAQTKILFNNEPIYLMTRTLLDYLLVDREKDYYVQACYRKTHEVLALFGLSKTKEELISFLSAFEASCDFWGIRFSLEEAFFKLGLSDSRHTEVWTKILSLIEVAENSLARFDIVLKKMSEELTSTRLEAFGKGPGVQIMTVHASKGLEFDAVFVAGIHNNGKSPVSRSKIGEEFLSLSWKLKKSDKKESKTPWMLLEQYRQKEIEFSESKRLFYVACTRARKELFFTDISYFKDGILEEVVFDKNSWITGLRSFFGGGIFKEIDQTQITLKNLSSLKDQESDEEVNSEIIEDENEDFSDDEDLSSAPPFHKSNLGIKINQRIERLGVVGEMSVTKLSEIVECPRKFYFNSVLKLKNDDLSIQKNSQDEEIDYVPASTKERGTELHDKIYHHLKGQLRGKEAVPEVLWVVEEIQKLNMPNAFLEKEMKFSFFGQMISGTPDWFNLDLANEVVTIVDYKTGALTEEKTLKYNAQVLIYAYGIKKLHSLSRNSTFSLLLFSIDERRIVSQTLNGNEVEELALNLWTKIYQLNQVRLAHCGHCNFQTYCQEKENKILPINSTFS